MKSSNEHEYLLVGKIMAPFGIKGEMKVAVITSSKEKRFCKGNILYLKKQEKYEEVTITSARFHKGNALITLNDIYDINLIGDFLGRELYVDRLLLNDLEENEYYCDDLIGLEVYNEKNEYLGKVNDIIELTSSDVLEVIDEKQKRTLIPFVDDLVTEVNDRIIIVKEIEWYNK